MAASLRRLASAMLFTSMPSPADGSQLDGRSSSAPFSGHAEREAGVGDVRCLRLSTMFIDMQIKDFIAHTRTVPKFRSVEQSWDTESYYYFRLPIEAAVTSFKLEIGENHAVEDETRPSKQASKLYNKAVRNKTPAAILKEVEPGIYQANLGRIPPDVQVTIVVKYAQRIPSNARGELIINCPAVSPSIRSSCSENTKIALNIEILQEHSIRTISSPTHQKLLSIKAGVVSAAKEVENFTSFRRRTATSSLEQPNQATVKLSGSHTVLDKDFELVIRTSSKARRTAALLSATNRFGHALLTITIRPCDLFNGEQDTEWSVDLELNHPWKCCSSDLGELSLTNVPHHGANLSPSTYKFVQSPKIIPRISHLQSFSVFFLLDLKGSTQYSIDSARISARRISGSHSVRTTTLEVNRTHKPDGILQKLCVSSILRDLHATVISQEHSQSYSEGRSFGLSSLVTSAERLGQMYSVCSQWTSKVAADSISDSDDDVDFKGPRPYDDELSRLTLPTHLSPPDRPAVNWTPQAPQTPSEPKDKPHYYGGYLAEDLSHLQVDPFASYETPSEQKVQPRYYGGYLAEDLSHLEVNPYASAEPSYPAMGQKPSHEAHATDAPLNRRNEYFVPRDGIDREVITADITRYLGNDALVRPGTYEKDGRAMQGYFVTAYRDLTSAMIADLKADSARWEQERRNYNSRTSRHGGRTGLDGREYTSYGHNTAAQSSYTTPSTVGWSSMSGVGQYQPQAPYRDSRMDVATRYHAYTPAYPNAPNDQSPYYADACFVAQRKESFSASQKAPDGQDYHEAQRIWPQVAASRSADGTYALSADLRNRVAAMFSHGTREWLAARIAANFPAESDPLALEAAADAMLVLAFVRIYIPLRYEEVEQGVALILKSGQDQGGILEDLVLRARERGRDYRRRRM